MTRERKTKNENSSQSRAICSTETVQRVQVLLFYQKKHILCYHLFVNTHTQIHTCLCNFAWISSRPAKVRTKEATTIQRKYKLPLPSSAAAHHITTATHQANELRRAKRANKRSMKFICRLIVIGKVGKRAKLPYMYIYYIHTRHTSNVMKHIIPKIASQRANEKERRKNVAWKPCSHIERCKEQTQNFAQIHLPL